MKPRNGIAPLLMCGLLIVACGGSSSKAPPPGSATSSSTESSTSTPPPTTESQRTREMEQKAADMNQRLEEAKASGEDPAKAWAEYEKERAELNQMGSGQQPVDEPPPPPE